MESNTMIRRCERCGKGMLRGHNVSHAKNKTRRYFKANLQKVRMKVGGTFVRVVLCARCVRVVRKAARARMNKGTLPLGPELKVEGKMQTVSKEEAPIKPAVA